MATIRNLTGQKFGRLTAITLIRGKYGSGQACKWLCECECGNKVEVIPSSLLNKNTQSCGCLRAEILALKNKQRAKHSGYKERLYGVWRAIQQRCYDVNRKDYLKYGGRGIVMCDEWKNDYSAFREWAISNGYDSDSPFMKCTLDRIDNDKGYSPDNCRWVDMSIQAKNRKERERNSDGTFKGTN